jgi:hypothetical protein
VKEEIMKMNDKKVEDIVYGKEIMVTNNVIHKYELI